MYSLDEREILERELKQAEIARSQNNEGRARVNARRAAGAALRFYWTQRGELARPLSAYDLLRQAAAEASGLPETVRSAAEKLLRKVDETHALPQDYDLMIEARRLIDGLDPLI